MIFNLSTPFGNSVNDNIDMRMKSVQYCSVVDVGQFLLRNAGANGAWMAKVDLSDAYRLVPINQCDWQYLGIKVGGKFYIDRMLPMGAASSCQIFQRISNTLKEMLLNQCQTKVTVFNYLDDFLFVTTSRENCERALNSFEVLCGQLRIPIAAHKTVRATQNITFLGLGINAKELTLYIPEEKRKKVENKLRAFLQEKAPRVKSWQSMAGSLCHLSQVVVSGRIFLSSMYGRLAGILSEKGQYRRSITPEVRQDIEIWLHLLEMTPEKPFKVLNPEESHLAPLVTDASTSVGFGAIWGNQWLYGHWPKNHSANIATLELYPIFVALSISYVTDAAIRVYTDNQALVSVLDRLYCRDAGLRKMMREIAKICMTKNIRLVASHIPGNLNIGPDLLSRGKVTEFFRLFPHMNKEPIKIPPHLSPSCGVINWKSN